jgi:hypothetical protein
MKKSKRVSIILAASALISAPSFAVPIDYLLNFDALLGPSGTGSFRYDAELLSLTNLTWDFGSGITGLVPFVSSIPRPTVGGTLSSVLAELLTQTDLDPPSNCIAPTSGSCRFSFLNLPASATPGGVNTLSFQVGPSFGSSVYYSFAPGTSGPFVPGLPPPPTVFGESTANGYVTARVAVSEPGTISMLLMGFLAFAIGIRKRASKA